MKLPSRKAAGALAIGAAALGLTLAIQGAGASEPDPSVDTVINGVSVPKGPQVDFCPTRQQVELHEQVYGFDYKPTIACSSGQPASPSDAQSDAAAREGEDRSCEATKALLESATPIEDRDPSQVAGVLPDGRQVIVEVFGDPKTLEGRTILDEAKDMQC